MPKPSSIRLVTDRQTDRHRVMADTALQLRRYSNVTWVNSTWATFLL